MSTSKFEQNVESATIKELTAIDSANFEDFDDYKKNGYRMSYQIKIQCCTETWSTKSTCCCSDFYSAFICKHIVGLVFYLKLKKIPKEAISTRIEQKRSRGRSSKAKKALVRE